MATTFADAFAKAGVIKQGEPTPKSKAKQQTITPKPNAASREARVDKQMVLTGTYRSLINPLDWNTHRVHLVHPSGETLTEVVAIRRDENDERFVWMWFEGQDDARKFRLEAEIRYTLTAL